MRREPVVLLVVAVVALIASGIDPHDRLTWWLEAGPVMVGAPLLVATYRRFPLTPLVYRLLLLHAMILLLGAHYTYALVPLGHWFAELFDLSRNHYDRLGHIAQGFVPAMLARELLVRTSALVGSRWLPWLVVSICLAFSALYEIAEWWVAVVAEDASISFLGTQGDVWDTQWDMFLALAGAAACLALLSRLHDRQLEALQ